MNHHPCVLSLICLTTLCLLRIRRSSLRLLFCLCHLLQVARSQSECLNRYTALRLHRDHHLFLQPHDLQLKELCHFRSTYHGQQATRMHFHRRPRHFPRTCLWRLLHLSRYTEPLRVQCACLRHHRQARRRLCRPSFVRLRIALTCEANRFIRSR